MRIAVLGNDDKSRSLLETVNEYKDGVQTVSCPEDADCLYVPDYTSLGFHRAGKLLREGTYIFFGKMGTLDMDELDTLVRIATEHHGAVVEYLHSACNPCLSALDKAVRQLEPIRRVRFCSCEYSFRCQNICEASECQRAPGVPGGALIQRGLDCIYPLIRLFGMPEGLESELVYGDNGMDVAGSVTGSVTGSMGPTEVELIYSKISGSHIPSLIEGKHGSLLIRDLHNLREVTCFNQLGQEECIASFTSGDCGRAELERCMAFFTGALDWRAQLPVSRRILQILREISGQIS